MNKNFTWNTIENDESISYPEGSDYQHLIAVLREISDTISLLEKKYLDQL